MPTATLTTMQLNCATLTQQLLLERTEIAADDAVGRLGGCRRCFPR
jgi:hypothetical protein